MQESFKPSSSSQVESPFFQVDYSDLVKVKHRRQAKQGPCRPATPGELREILAALRD